MTLYKVYSFETGNDLVEATTMKEAIDKVKAYYFKEWQSAHSEWAKHITSLPYEKFKVEKAVIIK